MGGWSNMGKYNAYFGIPKLQTPDVLSSLPREETTCCKNTANSMLQNTLGVLSCCFGEALLLIKLWEVSY